MEKLQRKCFYGAIGLAITFIMFLFMISMAAPFVVDGSYVVEAGRNLTIDKVIQNPLLRQFSAVCVQPKTDEVGEYSIIIRVGAQKIRTNAIVRDHIAPKVVVREVSVIKGNYCKIDEFIVSIDDATATTKEYVREPNFSAEGVQKIKIRVTDTSGNETVAETQLVVIGK